MPKAAARIADDSGPRFRANKRNERSNKECIEQEMRPSLLSGAVLLIGSATGGFA